jgi:hypothetical protein
VTAERSASEWPDLPLTIHTRRSGAANGRLKDHRTDQSEDRGIGANPDRQDQDSRDGEPRLAHERAPREPQILNAIDDRQPAGVAMGFARLLQPSEPDDGQPSRLVYGHPATHVFVDRQIEVCFELLIELTFVARIGQHAPHPRAQRSKTIEHRHLASSARMAKIRPITSESRCHDEVSSFSARRPGALIV